MIGRAMVLGAVLATQPLWGGVALAQGAPDGFTIGALGIASTSPYVGVDQTTALVPLLAWKQGNLSISTGEGLKYRLMDRNGLAISALLSPRFAPFDDADAPALAGMDRGFTADGGIVLEYAATDALRISLRAVTEVTGQHGGQEVSLGAQSRVAIGGFPVMLGGGAEWQSRALSDYTYGVAAGEATVGRPAYAPGDTVVPYLSVGTMIPINAQTRLFGSLKAEFLPNSVTASPIIDDSVVTSLALGVSFAF